MSVLVDAEYPPAHPGSGPWWLSSWGVGTGEGARAPSPHKAAELVDPSSLPPPRPGHDNLPERTGRALTDCPSTRIKTVLRGGGRLTADRPIIPETDVRLLNWRYPHEPPYRTFAPMGGHTLPVPPPRGDTRGKVVSALLTPALAQFFANMRQHALNPADTRSQGTVGMRSFHDERAAL